jgi:hypothetical protein
LVSAAVEPLHRGCAAGQCDQRTADQGLGTSRAGRPVPHVDRGSVEHMCGARRSRRAGPPQSVSALVSALVSCRAAHCAQPVDNRLAPHESGDQSRVLIAKSLEHVYGAWRSRIASPPSVDDPHSRFITPSFQGRSPFCDLARELIWVAFGVDRHMYSSESHRGK